MEEFRNHPLYKVHTLDTFMSSLWEYYKRNFLVLFVVSFIISLTTQYISSMVMIDINSLQAEAETDPMAVLEKMKEFIVPMAIISLLSLVFTVILQHYIIYNPVDETNTILKSVIRSLKYYIPFLIILILLSFTGAIAIVLGLLLLVVGAVFAGIYIALIYLFILPVMMAENTDIGSTITRVFMLAHRGFWKNFGWTAVFLAILIVTSMILSSLVLLPFSASFLKTIINPEDVTAVTDMTKNPVFIILSSLANALTIPLMPIFSAILYFNSRAAEQNLNNDYLPAKEENRVKVEDLYAKPYSDDHPENPENKKDSAE